MTSSADHAATVPEIPQSWERVKAVLPPADPSNPDDPATNLDTLAAIAHAKWMAAVALADRVTELEAELAEWRNSIATEKLRWRAEEAEARATESSASFIPRDTDEKPSDAMPSPGHKDWRETAEWWQSTCEYWKRACGEARERVETALRESALAYHKSNSHPRDFAVCTWPQCRRARAALGETAR